MNLVLGIVKKVCAFLLFAFLFVAGLAAGIIGLSLIFIGCNDNNMTQEAAGIALAAISTAIWIGLMWVDILHRERTKLSVR